MGGVDGRLVRFNEEKQGYCASYSSIELLHKPAPANHFYAKEINYPILASHSHIPVGEGILDSGILAMTRM